MHMVQIKVCIQPFGRSLFNQHVGVGEDNLAQGLRTLYNPYISGIMRLSVS